MMTIISKFWPLLLGLGLFLLAVSIRSHMASRIDFDQVQADAAVMSASASLHSAENKPAPTPEPDGRSPVRVVPKINNAMFEQAAPSKTPSAKGADQAMTIAKPKIDPAKYSAMPDFSVTAKPVTKPRPVVVKKPSPGVAPSAPIPTPRARRGLFFR
jgi:hypothetical protein